jgi:hypothetical protein
MAGLNITIYKHSEKANTFINEAKNLLYKSGLSIFQQTCLTNITPSINGRLAIIYSLKKDISLNGLIIKPNVSRLLTPGSGVNKTGLF